jgi:hypothetical protein
MKRTLNLNLSTHDVSTIVDALQYAAIMLSTQANCGIPSSLAKRAARVHAKLLEQTKRP